MAAEPHIVKRPEDLLLREAKGCRIRVRRRRDDLQIVEVGKDTLLRDPRDPRDDAAAETAVGLKRAVEEAPQKIGRFIPVA